MMNAYNQSIITDWHIQNLAWPNPKYSFRIQIKHILVAVQSVGNQLLQIARK